MTPISYKVASDVSDGQGFFNIALALPAPEGVKHHEGLTPETELVALTPILRTMPQHAYLEPSPNTHTQNHAGRHKAHA